MRDEQAFRQRIKDAADFFLCNTSLSTGDVATIRLVSHMDSDGMSAAALIIKALRDKGFSVNFDINYQITSQLLEKLKEAEETFIIFTDLGSTRKDQIATMLSGKKILILDHHETQEKFSENGSFFEVNPHHFGIDGSSEISGSGLAYLFTRELSEKNKKNAHLAIIGAIGDFQEKNGFRSFNKEILDDAISSDIILVQDDLKIYGVNSRSLSKALFFSEKLKLPGLKTESDVIDFLKEKEISDDENKRYSELSSSEKEKLIESIISLRKNLDNAEDVLEKRYIILNELPNSIFRDAREFSTILNACGRMQEAEIGINASLQDKTSKDKALNVYHRYKKEISSMLNWFEKNKKDPEKVLFGENFLILNARKDISHLVIGTLNSILTKSGRVKKNTLVLSMSRVDDTTTKTFA